MEVYFQDENSDAALLWLRKRQGHTQRLGTWSRSLQTFATNTTN